VFYLVYTTVPDEKSGEKIAKHLLNNKLIACANLTPASKSFYVWEGNLKNETEHLLFLKTTPDKMKTVEEEISKVHPYECPCILSWKSIQVHPPFLEWAIQSMA